jgi:alkanesulfonate monooxygenase SsuD/methylene tetrahydromethanopterin reductase-like flavin-dependent oxidoreductase (luciferase family)
MVSKVRIGLELPTDLLTTEQVMSLGKLADRRGLDSLWLQEGSGREVVGLLGALAGATGTIRLATGPINVYTRTPYLMAMTALTLDELSGGRFILGLTPGQSPAIETLHGLTISPPDDVPIRVAEILRIVKGLLAGEVVSLDGRFMHVQAARLPVDGPLAVPIYINARQAEMLEAAGELIDGAILSIATPQWVREFAVPHVSAGAARSGRDLSEVDIAYHPILCLSDDEPAAVEAARAVVAPYFQNAEVIDLLRAYGYADEIERIEEAKRRGAAVVASDELVRAITLVGDPTTVATRIEAYRDAGVNHMIIRPYPVAGQSAYEAAADAIEGLLV